MAPSGHVVPSRHGEVAVAWDHQDRYFAAVTASKLRWRAEHLDDLAIAVGARIPRAYVEDLLRDAGRPLPDWDPPSAAIGENWTEWDAAPVEMPALQDRLPPGVANRLKPAITAPSRTEPGGAARVETARRAVRAEWGAWVDEANARRELIENLGAVMQSLARGELVHEALRRLERVAHRIDRQIEVEQSPTLGALPFTPAGDAPVSVARRPAPVLAVPARTVRRTRGEVLTVPARARGLAHHAGRTCSCHGDQQHVEREYHERQ